MVAGSARSLKPYCGINQTKKKPRIAAGLLCLRLICCDNFIASKEPKSSERQVLSANLRGWWRRRKHGSRIELAVDGSPASPVVVPVQTPGAEDAIRVAVDRSPEEDVMDVAPLIHLPAVGNKVGMSQEVVENVGIQEWLLRELLEGLLVIDGFVAHMIRWEGNLLAIQEQIVALARELEVARLRVLFHLPAVWHERVGATVDDVVLDDNSELVTKEPIDTLLATQLVPDGFDAAQSVRILAHDISFPTSSRIFLLTLLGFEWFVPFVPDDDHTGSHSQKTSILKVFWL